MSESPEDRPTQGTGAAAIRPASAAVAPPDRDEVSAKKVGFAASLGFLLVLFSTTAALVSAFLLWRGDPGTDVLNALPKGCDWVLIAEDPVELRAAIADVASWHILPPALVAPLQTHARQLAADLDLAGGGLDQRAGLGLCRYRGAIALTVGLRPGAVDRVSALQRVAARRAGLDPAGWTPGASAQGFVAYSLADAEGRAAVALLQGESRALVVWADPGADADQRLNDVVKATQIAPMREDVVVRSAIERVGSGALQMAFAPAALQRVAAGWLAGHVPAELIGKHAEYAGISARRDLSNHETHLHLHVGAGQPGVAWLKSLLDPVGTLAASRHLDRDAVAGGVLRFSPDALRRHGPWLRRSALARALIDRVGVSRPAGAAAQDAAVRLGTVLTGHAVWQLGGGPTPWRLAAQVRPGQDGAAAALLPPPRPDQAVDAAVKDGWLVWAPGDPGAAVVASADLLASTGLGANLPQDQARMLDENQGFYLGEGAELPGLTRGKVQFEALWLPTGLVAHLTFPTPKRTLRAP